MGQYYHVLMGDELGENKQYFTPDVKLADGEVVYDGVKLMEHSYVDNRFMMGVASMLLNNPKRVIWVGDYANDVGWKDELAGGCYLLDKNDKNRKPEVDIPLYEDAWPLGSRKDRPVDDAPDFTWNGMYLINYDKKMYIDMVKYIKRNTVKMGRWCMCISPLSLLTEVGNGQGGGDYFGTDEEKLGTWAWDLIEVSETVPVGYEEISPVFKEER